MSFKISVSNLILICAAVNATFKMGPSLWRPGHGVGCTSSLGGSNCVRNIRESPWQISKNIVLVLTELEDDSEGVVAPWPLWCLPGDPSLWRSVNIRDRSFSTYSQRRMWTLCIHTMVSVRGWAMPMGKREYPWQIFEHIRTKTDVNFVYPY